MLMVDIGGSGVLIIDLFFFKGVRWNRIEEMSTSAICYREEQLGSEIHHNCQGARFYKSENLPS